MMKKTTQISYTRRDEPVIHGLNGGLPVRTNLRSGLAWDDLDDKAKDLWGKLTSTVSNAVSTVTGSPSNTTTS